MEEEKVVIKNDYKKTPEEYHEFKEKQRNRGERLKIVKLKRNKENKSKEDKILDTIEKILKVGIAVSLAMTIGCASYAIVNAINYRKNLYDENGIPKKIIAKSNGFETTFDKCYKYQVIDGKAIRNYKSKYIYFLVNKETNEIDEFVIFDGKEFHNNTIYKHIYDFDTEELLTFEKAVPDFFDDKYYNQVYYDYLVKEYDWFTLKDSLALFGENCKEYYTKEEIRDIEKQFIEAYKIVEEDKKRGI